MKFSPADERFMRRALALARRGIGRTSPNPAVGAVLVRGGKIIGEGWHNRAGGPHAEIGALWKSGCGSALPGAKRDGRARKGAPAMKSKAARGATLYVSLEPCCTSGKTPPCTDAIIAAGVKRVVIAATDPNPKHNGRGLRVLRRAGIRVESGLLAEEATALNASFNKWIVTGLPLVVAKAALSLDGKIATRTGDSQWITSESARRYGHKLRRQVDAVMVGAGTVIADNPRLTLRHGVRGRQPWRIVVDTRGRCPLSATIFNDKFRNRTMVVTGLRSQRPWRERLAARGVTVVVLPTRADHVGMRAMLRVLGRRGVTSVLVEGGGGLLGALFDARLVDRVAFFLAPKIVDGDDAKSAVEGRGGATMNKAWQLDGEWRRLGGDMLFEGRVR